MQMRNRGKAGYSEVDECDQALERDVFVTESSTSP